MWYSLHPSGFVRSSVQIAVALTLVKRYSAMLAGCWQVAIMECYYGKADACASIGIPDNPQGLIR